MGRAMHIDHEDLTEFQRLSHVAETVSGRPKHFAEGVHGSCSEEGGLSEDTLAAKNGVDSSQESADMVVDARSYEAILEDRVKILEATLLQQACLIPRETLEAALFEQAVTADSRQCQHADCCYPNCPCPPAESEHGS